jgi:hypothetical protein
MVLTEWNSFAIVAERVDVMVLSAAARKVAIQVEIMPAMMGGLRDVSSSWRGLYPAVVAMALSFLECVRRCFLQERHLGM